MTIDEIISHSESITDGLPLDNDERKALRILMEHAQRAAFERAAELTARLGEYRTGKQVAAELRKLQPE